MLKKTSVLSNFYFQLVVFFFLMDSILFVDFYRNELAHSCDELFSYGIDVPGEYYFKEDDRRFRVTCFKRGNFMIGLLNVNEKNSYRFYERERERERERELKDVNSFL